MRFLLVCLEMSTVGVLGCDMRVFSHSNSVTFTVVMGCVSMKSRVCHQKVIDLSNIGVFTRKYVVLMVIDNVCFIFFFYFFFLICGKEILGVRGREMWF